MRHFIAAILLSLILGLGASTRPAAASDIDMLPPELQTKIRNLMATRWPPELKNITLSPEQPEDGEPVMVSVEIYNDSEVTDDETNAVYIHFSIDGGKTWEHIELEQDNNPKVWTGFLPGLPSATEVLYGIEAIDSSGNVYVEAVCKTDGNPLEIENYVEDDCVHKGDSALCADHLPRGCMFPIARDDNPLDDESTLIPDNYDYWDYRVGYDDETLYLDLAVQGKIKPGSASPLNLNLYVGGVLNPDKPADGVDFQQITSQGAALIHGPLLTLTGGVAKPCSFLYKMGDSAIQDEQSVRCVVKNNHVVFAVNRNSIGPNPSKKLEFLAIDAVGTSISPVGGVLYDNSHFTFVWFDSRSYTVR